MKGALFEHLLESVREGFDLLRGRRRASRMFRFAGWDREIEADIKAGRLDELAEQALQDHQAGRTTDR